MAKLHDKETQSIAAAVSDVLEKKVKEEVKYPHMMYSPDGKDEVEVKDKAEHEKFAKKGYVHKKPDVKEVDEPRVPDGKNGPQTGEKDFKKKHAVKKSGEKEDGTVVKEKADDDTVAMIRANPKMKDKILRGLNPKARKAVIKALGEETIEEVTISIDEKLRAGKGKGTADVDYIGDSDLTKKLEKKFKVKIKNTGNTTADIIGNKQNVVNFLMNHYYFDAEDVEDMYPDLLEGNVKTAEEELSDKQKKYQAFFQKALKKFNVKSPAELPKEKRKEFFDYVDKNYDAGENETD